MVNITDYFSPKFFKIHMAFESKNYNIAPWDFNICQYNTYENYNIKGSICGRISTYTM